MRVITWYESKKELEDGLMGFEFKEFTKLENDNYKRFEIKIDPFLFTDSNFRGNHRFICSRIVKDIGEDYVEYLLWDDINWDFYNIEQEDMIEKIDEFIRSDINE